MDEEEAVNGLDDVQRKERWNLRKRLEELILREEISCNQNVKIKVVAEWDNYLKLFHRMQVERRSIN